MSDFSFLHPVEKKNVTPSEICIEYSEGLNVNIRSKNVCILRIYFQNQFNYKLNIVLIRGDTASCMLFAKINLS